MSPAVGSMRNGLCEFGVWVSRQFRPHSLLGTILSTADIEKKTLKTYCRIKYLINTVSQYINYTTILQYGNIIVFVI